MSSSFPRGGRNSTLSREAPLTKHLNRAKVVVMTAALVHHAEIMVVEVELVSGTGRL